MKTVTLSASFDGEHIKLEEEYPLLKNARLLVTVLPADSDGERAEWFGLAAQSLARGYSEHEPDYADSCVKEPN